MGLDVHNTYWQSVVNRSAVKVRRRHGKARAELCGTKDYRATDSLPNRWPGCRDGGESIPADAADERHTLRVRPAAELGQLVIIDQEVGGAAGADDRLLAVSPRFTPLQNIPERVALAFAEVSDDGSDARAQWSVQIYPGFESITRHLPAHELARRADQVCAGENRAPILSSVTIYVNRLR